MILLDCLTNILTLHTTKLVRRVDSKAAVTVINKPDYKSTEVRKLKVSILDAGLANYYYSVNF